MSVELIRNATAREAAEACARAVESRLETATAGGNIATFAISGGSSPVPMFAALANSPLNWARIHIFWVDEREVGPADEQSNYRLAREHLIVPARIPEKNVHRMEAELGAEEAARQYIREIREFFALDESRFPHFDVIHRGMGADGHTASLFPGESLIEEGSELVAAVWVPKLSQRRITLLPPVLRAARHTVVLATGDDKAEALRNVLRSEYEPKLFPAQIGLQDDRRIAWFIDEAAGRLIE
jgi:6-phosphogluconolactonase